MLGFLRLFAAEDRANRREFLGVTAAVFGSELLLVWGMHGAANIALVRANVGWIYGLSLLVGGWLLVHAAFRRAHDVNRSGASVFVVFFASLLLMLPLRFVWSGGKAAEGWMISGFLALGFTALAAWPGTPGPNRYSPRAPRARRSGDAETVTAQQLLARMRRMARPTLLLTPTAEQGFSKLCGDPELPSTIDWPAGHSSPRAFVAQLDLAEVRAAEGPEWLPAEGRLYAFYDPEGGGSADQVVILSSRDAPGPARTPPPGLSPKLRFPERRAGFLRLTSFSTLDWLGIDVRELDVEPKELDELSALADEPFGDEAQHRIGGYPSEIQEANMPLECEHLARGLDYRFDDDVAPAVARAAKSWRLLLQIDSDPALKMNWGDGGCLYVFIREKHALAGDFSKTVSLSQSY